jgi:hypothetical protein
LTLFWAFPYCIEPAPDFEGAFSIHIAQPPLISVIHQQHLLLAALAGYEQTITQRGSANDDLISEPVLGAAGQHHQSMFNTNTWKLLHEYRFSQGC